MRHHDSNGWQVAGYDGVSLPAGTRLGGRYVIERTIAAGGFGITYAARHVALDRIVAIKEHFPRQLAARDPTTKRVEPTNPPVYEWALARFLQEGRTLARCKHPSIVDVSDVFEANATAYMVLAYEDGVSLERWLVDLGRAPTQAELDRIVTSLLDALAAVHEVGLLHRDIAPDNVIIRRDGSPCLIDFGAARAAIADQSQALSAIVKAGYSPPEQYTTSGRAQGAWSDIYAFGATLRRCVTGSRPHEATDRMIGDRMGSIAEAGIDRNAWRSSFLDGIDAAMRLKQAERPQSIAELRGILFGSIGDDETQRREEQPGRYSNPARRPAGTEAAPGEAASAGSSWHGSPTVSKSEESRPAPDRGGSPTPEATALGWRLLVLGGIAGVFIGLTTLGALLFRDGVPPQGGGSPAPQQTVPQVPTRAPAEPPRETTASPAPPPASAAPQPPPAAAAPTPRDCSGIRVPGTCNAEKGCTWSFVRSVCLPDATAAPIAGQPAPAAAGPPVPGAERTRCNGLDVGRCSSAAGCEWRVTSQSCIAITPPSAGPPPSAPRGNDPIDCTTFRTIAGCNRQPHCSWRVTSDSCRVVGQ